MMGHSRHHLLYMARIEVANLDFTCRSTGRSAKGFDRSCNCPGPLICLAGLPPPYVYDLVHPSFCLPALALLPPLSGTLAG
eukprot:1150051-Pelagomonas_calceolata.AAC.5